MQSEELRFDTKAFLGLGCVLVAQSSMNLTFWIRYTKFGVKGPCGYSLCYRQNRDYVQIHKGDEKHIAWRGQIELEPYTTSFAT